MDEPGDEELRRAVRHAEIDAEILRMADAVHAAGRDRAPPPSLVEAWERAEVPEELGEARDRGQLELWHRARAVVGALAGSAVEARERGADEKRPGDAPEPLDPHGTGA